MGGVAVLHRPVEEATTPFRAPFDDREVIGRERDGGEAPEELVRIAHRLAVDAGVAAVAPDFDLHFAHPGGQIELPRHQRGALTADAHQLRELVRAQGPQAAEQVAGLQEVRLALPVRSEEDGGMARERDALLDEVAEVASLDLEKKHLLLHAHVDRHARAGAPALVLRGATRRRFPRLPADVDGRAGRHSLGAGLERRTRKDAERPIERLPVRVALLDAALGAVLAIRVLLAALAQSCRARIPRRPLSGSRVARGCEEERCQEEVHQIRIGMITAVYRAPAPGAPVGLSTPGESSSQSSTFICAVSTTWSTSIRYRALKPICSGRPLYVTGISSFASPRSGFCEVTFSEPSWSSKRTAFVLRSLESRLMRFRVSSKRGRSTVIVRSAPFGITCM